MTTTRSSRLFTNGSATTLYLTSPAQFVTDSQFPFAAEDAVVVSIDGGRLVITARSEDAD